MTRLTLNPCIVLSLALSLFPLPASGQGDTDLSQPASPIVTVTAAARQIRFASLGEVRRLRLTVFSEGGRKVFESKWRSGNVLDWRITDDQGQRLVDGSYLFFVWVKDFAESVTRKYGWAAVQSGQVYLETEGRELPRSDEVSAFGVGQAGEPMTPVNRIGVEVAGAAQSTTAAGSAPGDSTDAEQSSGTPGGEPHPTPTVSRVRGRGTPGRIAKWLTPVRLGDSVITESNGSIGIHAPNPMRALQIGASFDAAFTFEPADISPNAGYVRFGDQTGWKLHFGRSREHSAGSLNVGTVGALMTLQDNGNLGIGTIDPTAKLDVRGDIRLGTEGNYLVPGGHENLRVIRGTVARDGAILAGSAFSVTRTTSGRYSIVFDTAFAGQPTVNITTQREPGDGPTFAFLAGLVSTDVAVQVVDGVIDPGVGRDAPFSFIAIGPR